MIIEKPIVFYGNFRVLGQTLIQYILTSKSYNRVAPASRYIRISALSVSTMPTSRSAI